jgi:hypothetical protein
VTTLADIFRRHGPEYLKQYGSRLLPSHKRVIRDVILCRTEPLGGQVWFCKDCRDYHYSFHSCRNRHCPNCQNQSTDLWLENQKNLLLPVPYFMATFTVPEHLRPIFRSHQMVMYHLFFRTSANATQALAQDNRFVGGTLGMIGVLQTWTKDLRYHPHIHYLIPGGGLSPDRKKWKPAKHDFLIHEKPLSILFKAKFRDACKKAGLYELIPKSVWKQDWVTKIIPVGTGETALKYLAPYIFRVAISNRNILSMKNGRVSFRFKSQTNQFKLCTLDALEFIRRFLQHVLPKGFVKVRYYGFFSSQKKALLDRVKELLRQLFAPVKKIYQKVTTSFRCPKCGKAMSLIGEFSKKRGPPLPVLLNVQIS